MSPPTTVLRRAQPRLFTIAFVASCAVVGCARREQLPQLRSPRGRVLILAIDGTEPRLVRQWMEDGTLPNLRSLSERGSFARIRGSQPILSPRIWTSVATGKSPELHGIEGWIQHEWAGDRLYQGAHRHGAAIWNIASAAGLRVATINWLATHPPEKLDGVVISELATPGRRHDIEVLAHRFGWEGDTPPQFTITAAWPPTWLERVAEIAQRGETFPDVETPLLAPLQGIRKDDELVARVALEVEAEVSPDLLMVLLQGNDRAAHYYWHGVANPERYPAARRPGRRREAAEALRAYYGFTDFVVGRFLQRFGPDDLVIVLSDHGFEPAVRPNRPGITGVHESDRALDGVLFVAGPGVPEGVEFEPVSAEDVTPTVLAWLGLPVGRDMTGRVMGFLDCDPPDTLRSWDVIPIERSDVETEALDAALVARLKTLGYVE